MKKGMAKEDFFSRITVIVLFSLVLSACNNDNNESHNNNNNDNNNNDHNALYESEFVQATAMGMYNHSDADDVHLTAIFNTTNNTIKYIIYDPLASENNTSDTRAENTGRDGQTDDGVPEYMRYLIPWRNNRDLLLSGMIGLNALVLAEMTNVFHTGLDVEFDGKTLDAVTGATKTRNSFINAVIEASRLYRDGKAQPSDWTPSPPDFKK